MLLPKLIIVHIMGWGDLEGPCPKFHINVSIGYNCNRSIKKNNNKSCNEINKKSMVSDENI